MSGAPSGPSLPQALLKVCGATGVRDVEVAAAAGADCVGLWHGVPGGPRELGRQAFLDLAAVARRAGLLPAWVTFLADPAVLVRTAQQADVGWVQLHAYQPPSVVGELRRVLPRSVGIVKVLHVGAGGRCVERPLIGAYERAGADLFLLDAATEDGRIGSTGQSLDPVDVVALLPRLSRPFLLAGGLTPTARARYEEVVGHRGFRGIDVDTAARAAQGGGFDAARIAALVGAWKTGGGRGSSTVFEGTAALGSTRVSGRTPASDDAVVLGGSPPSVVRPGC
ncbi:N-(5'-phosphoribosyl)anthranilate isomerase [Streptomyces sp. NPDC058872]|uniref:phosphoribosylanthranilate isomerase n=1 Tax=Streptomyces sp. NPDC058872 TaxID=3346661 RepID=UPI0036924A40